MGLYFEPGNSGFQEVVRSEYVDKTGLIGLINRTIGTKDKLTCISRPRRFGKSYAAQMLCAYYDCSCDSHELFDDREVAATEEYKDHLNRYHVVGIDVAGFVSMLKKQHKAMADIPGLIEKRIYEEMVAVYPELEQAGTLTDAFVKCVEITGRKIIFVIDEWDALIREAKQDEGAQIAYLNLLREWFKNINFTPKVVAAAYMTGILPIKKDGSQSAISDFSEYPILDPGEFAGYTGFTQNEVREICDKHGMSFEEAKNWYDGYDFQGIGAIYNPYSVMQAMKKKKYSSYLKKTSAAESLLTYINMDFAGLQETISRLIAGEEMEVDTESFENDFATFRNRDDVLTLLIHLGYLTWNETDGTAHIPNEEIRTEFRKILKSGDVNQGWVELLARSQKLLEDTIAERSDCVAKAIDMMRETQYAPTFYNDEQALRYVIKFAYIAAIDQYIKVEELPSGKGIADVVYLPKRRSVLPAMIIELKWDKTSEGAISQIKDRNYPAVLQDYGGEIVLVGINYNPKTKVHTCKIERAQ